VPALKIPVPIWFALLFRRWFKVRVGPHWAYIERRSNAEPVNIYIVLDWREK
jgi:hypothetical protein